MWDFIFGFLLGAMCTGIGAYIGPRKYTMEEAIDEVAKSIELHRDKTSECAVCHRPWKDKSTKVLEGFNVDSS